jgi:flagellar hook protein FlgE
MLRSLFTAISGLTNSQTRLDVIANNIANVNTTGFKSGRANFQDMMSQTLSGASPEEGGLGGTDAKQVGLGVNISSIDNIQVQGALQSTGIQTDLAIQGDGFFILNNGSNNLYTRDGTFTLDEQGDLVAANGMKVQGWTAANGVIDTTQPLNGLTVPLAARMQARMTNNVTVIGNLDSRTVAGGTYANNFQVYDSLGDSHDVTITYTNTGPDTWDWAATGVNVAGNGTVAFDVNGQMLGQTGNVTLTTVNGSTTPQVINPTFNNMTQLAQANTVNLVNQDGYAPGTLSAYNISNSGIITGVFDNGINQVLGQVALARFNNAGGLIKNGDNMWSETANSGVPLVGTANSGARGSIQAGALEMSNVNLAQEFSEMIITQRGFQANARVITTSDDILQELINLKRS